MSNLVRFHTCLLLNERFNNKAAILEAQDGDSNVGQNVAPKMDNATAQKKSRNPMTTMTKPNQNLTMTTLVRKMPRLEKGGKQRKHKNRRKKKSKDKKGV